MSNLPGAVSKPDRGATCDDHPDLMAVVRVQGETDSFGCEHIHMCEQCKKAHDEHRDRLGGASHVGHCDRCGGEHPLFPLRDYDEGLSGPVFYRCRSCRNDFMRRAYAALDEDRDD